jgi:hypothetical protein
MPTPPLDPRDRVFALSISPCAMPDSEIGGDRPGYKRQCRLAADDSLALHHISVSSLTTVDIAMIPESRTGHEEFRIIEALGAPVHEHRQAIFRLLVERGPGTMPDQSSVAKAFQEFAEALVAQHPACGHAPDIYRVPSTRIARRAGTIRLHSARAWHRGCAGIVLSKLTAAEQGEMSSFLVVPRSRRPQGCL